MEKTIRTELREGDIVHVQGYQFVASNVTKEHFRGYLWVWSFNGTMTDDARNDSLRHTGYNGGRYTWRVGEG
jgi:hypothetical protein